MAPPDASTPETHSVPFQEAHLNSEASLDTRQVVESRPVVTSSTQRSTDDASMGEPSLIPENDEGDRMNKQITDGSSIESLQVDLDFVLKQHAIMDQIMADQSRSQNSEDRSMRSNPSTDDFTSRASLCQDSLPSRNFNTMNFDYIDQEENDDFLDFLNDPVILEEQRRIMNDIVSLSPHSLNGHAEPPPSKPSPFSDQASLSSVLAHSSPTRVVNDEIMGYIEEAARFISFPPPIGRQQGQLFHHVRASSEPISCLDLPILDPSPRRAKSASPLLEISNESQTPEKETKYSTQYEQDGHVKIYQGKRIQVRGTNHTWKKIAKGNATLVQCPVCSTILQVGTSARLLFCTKCNEVSPISVHMNSSMDYRADGLIAVVVQQQEVDVAFAMKMARNAPSKK